MNEADTAAVAAQLGRRPRALRAVAHRCPCGLPDVVESYPRLDDGTPFPTLFYLTCPRASAAVSRLEAAGLMRRLTDELSRDPELAAGYARAHQDYLARREALGHVPEITGISAGGMPDRVSVRWISVLSRHAEGAASRTLRYDTSRYGSRTSTCDRNNSSEGIVNRRLSSRR